MKKIREIDSDLFEDYLNKFVIISRDFTAFINNYSNKEIDNYIYKVSDNIFIKYCYLTLTPQSYGSKFQKRFEQQFNLCKVNSADECGDFTNGKLYFEYKVSIINSENPIVDIVQIRPNHKMTHYIIQIVDVRELENSNIYATLCLTKDQMNNELILTGSQSAHAKKGNATEFRIDFKFGSDVFNRFINNYTFNESIIKIID